MSVRVAQLRPTQPAAPNAACAEAVQRAQCAVALLRAGCPALARLELFRAAEALADAQAQPQRCPECGGAGLDEDARCGACGGSGLEAA